MISAYRSTHPEHRFQAACLALALLVTVRSALMAQNAKPAAAAPARQAAPQARPSAPPPQNRSQPAPVQPQQQRSYPQGAATQQQRLPYGQQAPYNQQRPAPAQQQPGVQQQPYGQRPAFGQQPGQQQQSGGPQRSGYGEQRQYGQPSPGFRPPNAQQPGQAAGFAVHAPAIPQGSRAQTIGGGGHQYTDQAGRTYRTNPQNRITEFRDQTHVAQYDARGQARFVQATHNGMTTSVTQGFGHQRIVQTRFADGTRVVSYGPRSGFAEHAIANRPGYISRTWAGPGGNRVAVYRTYTYQNHPYYQYVPPVYYRPAFYGWVNTPWSSPIFYGWGTPVWAGVYGGYYQPYASYPSADYWLTDYLFDQNLAAAYATHEDDFGELAPQYPPPPPGSDPGNPGYTNNNYVIPNQSGAGGSAPYSSAPAQASLDPSVKALIAQQVRVEVAEMRNAANNPNGAAPPPNQEMMPDVLKPDHTAFEVSTDMQLTYGDNQTCVLTAGDVLYRRPDSMADASQNVAVTVVGRKPGSCDLNTTAKVDVNTLQEINNQFDRQIQSGMDILAAKEGKGPFPLGPQAAPTQVAAGQDQGMDAATYMSKAEADGQQTLAEVDSAASSPR